MQASPTRRALRILVVATIITALTIATPAVATPSPIPLNTDPSLSFAVDSATQTFRDQLTSKQAQVEALRLQLDELDRELGIAAEEFNRAASQLDETRNRLFATQDDLSKAETAYEYQRELLEDRASEIYRAGELEPLDVLLGSKSVADFIARLRFLNAIGASDADVAEQLRAQRDQIAEYAAALEEAEVQANSLEFELKARQIELMLRAQDRQSLLERTEAEIVALLEAEAERRRVEDSALLADVLAGANKAGIVVTPGSPVETALAYTGVPYVWAGESPSGFDCSGLVLYVFKQHGVSLPHYSGSQYRLGTPVSMTDLQPGDAVFFGSPVYHVGIYAGAGYFIHAPRTGDFVKLSKLAERRDYVGARRYTWSYRSGPILGAVTNPADAVR
jgi:peptidoglycan hydrolase CwlO-like protein